MSSVGGEQCTNHRTSYHTKENCNVVIFGQTGAGKSSLINLVAGTQTARISRDAMGCTTGINKYGVSIQSNLLQVQLFDTPGLGEGPEGTVPDKKARETVKTLIQDLMKQNDIHLLIYCVQGGTAMKALRRNYNFICSEVKERVPIVLVATSLERKEPEMEQWWRDNERSISKSRMTFAGHACVTTIDEIAGDKLKRRHEESHYAICQVIELYRLKGATRRKTIVLFGETGAGQSSLVNLIAGMAVAHTSPDMGRCTMGWTEYTIDFDGGSYTIFDTRGLNDPWIKPEEYLESVENAYRLVRELDGRDGIDLLLFCVRAGRGTATLRSNYRLFHEFLCEQKVPIVLAITNLEREERMEDWWKRNEATFKEHEIKVAGHACITAANKLDGRHKNLYEQSRTTIRNLVKEFTADGQKQAWTGGHNLFVSFMRKQKVLLTGSLPVRKKDLVPHLTKRCGISPDVAEELANMIEASTSH
ncbi:P-loop containing nucleoside triphosphate hydrolase protein [Suillus fuscotomentosus]|uniref:P-loop containing nucleoside triphosphate hydrolase protein n=1 Tax=Suillus fuscotomentosus TaxID=1912939 RepID=A0AAD4E0J6_9AGAM|nr:P-loop containing nucleoside triphosphate hydrolase protein [Suillus fuscotomentosus]KAG1896043.1 P-loop containing nucleoside triphosphate hydrolase protein [Suillus fuscotomentosus]